ncbi:MAG: ATPase [Prevotella sp.]|jgi:N-acetylglucosamine kinase-like BadF-type ATPase
MESILIADSGSTKTDWCLLHKDGEPIRVQTKGLNPFQMTQEEIGEEIKTTLLPVLPTSEVSAVYFYGAGCTPEKQAVVGQALRNCLTITGSCEVASDMLGAARAICGQEPGIACILGTGSNSCAFDGRRIIKNVSPLGYILGDEGSGAVLGRALLGDVMKNQLPQHIIDRFHEKYKFTNADIIERVYRQKSPNSFLASFAPFLYENVNEPCIEALVKDEFRRFLRRNVRQYSGWESLPIGFIGSIATYFRVQLKEVMQEESMHLGQIMQAPIEGLVEFHKKLF